MKTKGTLLEDVVDESGDSALDVPAGAQVEVIEEADDLLVVRVKGGSTFPVEASLVRLVK